jgi:outer membrane biosynthesis protein TonB
MTLTYVSVDDLPSTNPFLNSVCPGFPYLDDNVHYQLNKELLNKQDMSIHWPITNPSSTTIAKLEPTYLNIARPPLNGSNNESTTYVSLPYHVTGLFKDIVKHKDKKLEGNMHIGANVNPLIHDPFKNIAINPGCLSTIIDIHSSNPQRDSHTHQSDINNKNPFNKLTLNFNKLLKFTTGNNATDRADHDFQSLHQYVDKKLPFGLVLIDKVLEYDQTTYLNELQSQQTSKLLISSHVNILNVFTIDSKGAYKNTKELKTTKPIVPYFHEEDENDASKSTAATTESAPSVASSASSTTYRKVIEKPLLRIQFHQNCIITSLKSFVTFSKEPIVVLGLGSGEIVIINLMEFTYQVFDNLGQSTSPYRNNSDCASIKSGNSGACTNTLATSTSVSSLQIITHPLYEFLIVAGLSNGEIMILDPYAEKETPANTVSSFLSDEKLRKASGSQTRYVKKVVGSDSCITFFKKFDLSPFKRLIDPKTSSDDPFYPHYLIGHFKVSHKPITAITSTIPHQSPFSEQERTYQHPMLLAIACDDGFVRIIDFIFTAGCNFGDSDPKTNHSILTDAISNYFNDGITHLEFSPDLKFLSIVGSGDLIEMYKMSYYNINGLLSKNQANNSHHHSHTNVSTLSNGPGRRSRSGTVNSVNSDTPQRPSAASLFLSPMNITPSNSVDFNRNEQYQARMVNHYPREVYPPIVKDITIVGRFKGHTNTCQGIKFVKEPTKELEPTGTLAYKLISYGYDGKVIIWEFDYRALPKLKKVKTAEKKKKKDISKPTKAPSATGTPTLSQNPNSSQPQQNPPQNHPQNLPHTATQTSALLGIRIPQNTGQLGNIPIKSNLNFHARSRSLHSEEFTTSLIAVNSPTFNNLNASLNNQSSGGSAMNMTTLLTATTSSTSNISSSVPETLANGEFSVDQIEIVTSLYKSLFDLRFKRHYKTSGTKKNSKLATIFHQIVDDKLVPSIDIPICSLDLSPFVHDGKIGGVYLDENNLWIFGKNGDVFRL